jgi:hypothetical protein
MKIEEIGMRSFTEVVEENAKKITRKASRI